MAPCQAGFIPAQKGNITVKLPDSDITRTFQLLTFSLFKFFGEMLVFYIGGRLFLLNFLNIWHKSIMNPDKQRT